jgi:hypothetical protein
MGNRIAYPLGQAPVWHGHARVQKNIGGVIPLVVGDLATGGTVQLFRVPAGFNLTGASIDLPQLDTGNALTLSLGTAAVPTLILNASTAGRAATAAVPIALGARGYRFAADTDIVLTAAAGAAAAVAGSIVVFLHGFIDP